MDWMTWYNTLAKPDWTPSPSTIGLIFTPILFGLCTLTLVSVDILVVLSTIA